MALNFASRYGGRKQVYKGYPTTIAAPIRTMRVVWRASSWVPKEPGGAR